MVGRQYVALTPPLLLVYWIYEEDPAGFQLHQLNQLFEGRIERRAYVHGLIQGLSDLVEGGQVLNQIGFGRAQVLLAN